ncbi:MAG: LON peptidase substrate-binding domain-containing protein [Candidatus Nanopelagicales bacterium]
MPQIALFPLRSVLVPGLVLPLHIFEPRYRLMIQMLDEAAEDERGFGVVAIPPGSDPDEPGGLYEVGTFARLLQSTELDDGRFDIVTVGSTRFRIDSLVPGMPFAQARVHLLAEPLGPRDDLADLVATASGLLLAYRRRISDFGVIDVPEIEHLPTAATTLSYLISAALVTDLPYRQQLLTAVTTVSRLRAQCDFMRRELALMAALPSMPAVDLAEDPPPLN